MQINTKRLFLIIGLICVILPAVAFAAAIKTDTNLAQGEVVSGNLYITGSAPVVAGTVHGDLIAAGGTVVVTGNIAEDALVAGGNVNVTGQVGGDLRVFGGSVYIDSEVSGEVFTAGGDVRFGPNAVINGDLIANGGNVQLNPSTKVYGDKKIKTGEDIENSFAKNGGLPKVLQTAFLVGQVISILSLLLVAVLFFGFFPALTNKIVAKSLEKGAVWTNLGLGLLMLLLMPIAAVVCFFTGIGALLGLLLIFAFILYIIFGIAFAGITFGGWLYHVTKKPKKLQITWGALILGVVLLHIINLVPFIGWIAAIIFILITWGGALRMKWELIRGIK